MSLPQPQQGAEQEQGTPADSRYMVDLREIQGWRQAEMDRQSWRFDTATENEYYDSNQFDDETVRARREKGLALIPVNCIYTPINTVIGTFEKSQSDWICRVENNPMEELATALSHQIKVAERMTQADRACLDACGSQVKGGIGWVEVGRNDDPFEYKYRVDTIPWREMSWDWRARRPDLADAQYIRRQRFYRRDELAQAFPQHTGLFTVAGTSSDVTQWAEGEQLQRSDKVWRDSPRVYLEWMDPWHKMLSLEEWYYRVSVTGYIVRSPKGQVYEFDQRNPVHMEAYNRGLVQPEAARFKKVRQAFWLGPHRILDRWSPHAHNDFPYVPFFGHQEDSTGVPYGLIRVMRPLQDEINARRARMMWGLDAKRIIVDDDAVMDHDEAANEINRSDAYIRLNPNRKPSSQFKVDEHGQMNAQQWQVYLDAKQSLESVGGTHASFLGRNAPEANSGVAIQSLVDQTITSIGKIAANYRESRRKVGQLLLAEVMKDMQGKPNHELEYENRDGNRKSVTVNVPTQTEGGMSYLSNNVELMRVQVVLDETPATPTWRAQQFQEILRVLQTMPDDVKALMIPIMVEMSELPDRIKIADLLKQKLGIAEPKSPEEAAAMKEKQDKLKRQELLAEQELQGKAEQATAKADLEKAQKEKTEAETDHVRAQTVQVLQTIDNGGVKPGTEKPGGERVPEEVLGTA